MSEEHRVKGECSNRSVRTLAVLTSAAMVSLLSAQASAVIGPLCGSVSCTGGTPTITINGGGLHHAEVVPIFWGSWSDGQQAQVVGMIQQMVNGPYLGALGQYGGSSIQVGPARMVPTAPIRPGSPTGRCNNGAACTNFHGAGSCDLIDGSTCGYLDALNMINATISAGIVPPPATSQNVDILYIAFPPAGYTNFAFNTSGSWNGRTYKFAWNPGSGVGSAPGLAHELVEAITQNVVVTGCGGANQIVDLCCNFSTQGGLQLPGYWSVANNSCVAPEGWAGVWRYENSPNVWTQINSATVRQVYAGGFGVAATDTADNLVYNAPGTNSWTTISGPGSMFAVSTSSIVRLSQNADNVSIYNGSPFSWSTIHGFRSAVYAGSRVVTTDFVGTEFSWLGSGDSWANIGKAGDQIVVTGTGRVYGIALDHNSVWMTPDNSGVWSQVGAPSSELFGGLTANPAGTPVQPITSRDIWMYQGSGQTWLRQNGPGVMFALAGSGPDLFMLNSTRSAVLQSTNIHVTNPAWTTIRSGGFGRLVGSGNQLYAVGFPVF